MSTEATLFALVPIVVVVGSAAWGLARILGRMDVRIGRLEEKIDGIIDTVEKRFRLTSARDHDQAPSRRGSA